MNVQFAGVGESSQTAAGPGSEMSFGAHSSASPHQAVTIVAVPVASAGNAESAASASSYDAHARDPFVKLPQQGSVGPAAATRATSARRLSDLSPPELTAALIAQLIAISTIAKSAGAKRRAKS